MIWFSFGTVQFSFLAQSGIKHAVLTYYLVFHIFMFAQGRGEWEGSASKIQFTIGQHIKNVN